METTHNNLKWTNIKKKKKHNTKYSHEITREGGKERRKEHKKKIATKNQGKMKISI